MVCRYIDNQISLTVGQTPTPVSNSEECRQPTSQVHYILMSEKGKPI
jgi:hypothetical protein